MSRARPAEGAVRPPRPTGAEPGGVLGAGPRSGRARTLWEEGRLPGRRVVGLGVLVASGAAAADVALDGRLGALFDVCFVGLCVAAALAVRRADFFTVGVLPPLLLLGLFVVVGAADPAAVAAEGDGPVQAVVSALAHHAGALAVGYALCLSALAVRVRVLDRESAA